MRVSCRWHYRRVIFNTITVIHMVLVPYKCTNVVAMYVKIQLSDGILTGDKISSYHNHNVN
mgnify:CR=1 FL=1